MLMRASNLKHVMVVFVLVSAVCAQGVTWTNGGGDRLWSNPANWDPQAVPIGVEPVLDNGDTPGPIVKTDVICNRMRIASAGRGDLTVDGGTLTMTQAPGLDGQLVVTQNNGSDGTLTIKRGTVSIPTAFSVSWRGKGTVNMDGGLMTINGAFKFTNKNTSVSTLNLSGGRIEVVDLIWQVEGDNGSSLLMDVTGGMMVLNGDRRAVIQEGIDKGFLVAYGGKGGTIVRDYDEVANITTITAKHELNPIPADGGLILPNNAGQVTLEWTLLDPCSPGSPTRVDVYVTDDYDKLFNFLDPESIRVVNGQSLTSVTVPVGLKKEYYWAVDSYLNNSGQPKLGPIFRFYVDHARPEVDAGANITTFLQDGIISGPLVGTATDDGVVHALTVEWSVLSQPDDVNAPAVIAESTALETSITMTVAGTYVLQLQADDGEYKSTDTLTITVFGDIWNIED